MVQGMKKHLVLWLSVCCMVTTAVATPAITWIDPSLSPGGNTQMEGYSMPRFSQGLMAVSKEVAGETRYGYMNTQGELTISPYYLEAGAFGEGLAPVKVLVSQEEADENLRQFLGAGWTGTQGEEGMVERYGFINEYGHIVVAPCFLRAYSFADGLAAVEVTPGIWGYMTPTGGKAFETLFHWAGDFVGDYAVVSTNGLYGVVDRQGNYVIRPFYESIAQGDGAFLVYDQGRFRVMNLEGQWLSSSGFDQGGGFSQGLALVEEDGLWGYVDQAGQTALAPQYSEAYHFQDGLAWVWVNGRYQYIDCNGRLALVADYVQVSSFSQGYARVKEGIHFGFIDKTGAEVVPVTYRDAVAVSEGYGLVFDGTQWGIFSRELTVADWAEPFALEADSLGLLPGEMEGIDLSRALTRTEFVSLVMSLYEKIGENEAIALVATVPCPSENLFVDSRNQAVRQAFSLGIATGKSPEYFAAYETIDREQAATMLLALYETITATTVPLVEGGEFADQGEISTWAWRAVGFLSQEGVVSGVGGGRFDPQSPISGQEALVMAMGMLEIF